MAAAVPTPLSRLPSRILIIRPSALGDVCRTVPVLVSLRAAWPGAHIAWLVQKGFEPAIAHHPALDEVIPFDRKRMAVKRLWTPDGLTALFGLVERLRRGRYDLVLDCQGLGRSGLFTAMTGARTRVGHRQARELAWLGYNRRIDSSMDRHTVDRMLDLVRGLGIQVLPDMRLYPGEAAEAWADEALGPANGARTVVLAPTSRWAGKRWPIERFVALATTLLDQHGVERVVVVGGPGEREQCEPLLAMAASDTRVVDLVGKTGVGELLALIGRARLVVASDSAAMHMAVGMGVPLVGLFGPTRIDLVGPYGRAGDVLQAELPRDGLSHKDEAAGRAMMGRIGLEAVLAACADRLRASD